MLLAKSSLGAYNKSKKEYTMKKRIIILSLVAVLVILTAALWPVKTYAYDDGGTLEIKTPICKVVHWNCMDRDEEDGIYSRLRIYFGDDKDKSIGELWKTEKNA